MHPQFFSLPVPFLLFSLSSPAKGTRCVAIRRDTHRCVKYIYIYIFNTLTRKGAHLSNSAFRPREFNISSARTAFIFNRRARSRVSSPFPCPRSGEKERERERERKLRGRIRKVRRRERRQIYGAMQGGEREGKGDRVRHRIGPGEYVGDFPPFPWTSP